MKRSSLLIISQLIGIGVFAATDTLKPPKRAHHALVYDDYRNCIFMTSGSTPLEGGRSFSFFNDNWCLSPNGWSFMGNSGTQRSGIRMAYNNREKKIYSFGGYSGDSSLSDLRVFENDTWKTIGWLPEMKAAEPGFVYDIARDRFILFGGSGGRGAVNRDTWEWDGQTWKKFPGDNPGARQAFAMEYDSKRNTTILFGGMGETPNSVYADTWEFNGTSWKKITETGPGSRVSPGFAFDEKNGMFIIFGGMTNSGMMADTWGWDGKKWKKLADTGPPARAMGYLAYDKQRERVILFGGRAGWPNDLDDTWEWNGKSWKEIK